MTRARVAPLQGRTTAGCRGALDPERRVVRISEILSFYTEDFLADAPSLVAYVNRYRPAPVPEDYEVEFIDYDWRINNQPENLGTAAR
jgi:hypothetical protein